jgi:hypothetical protein
MVNTCEPAQRPSRRIKLKWLTSLSQKGTEAGGGFNGATSWSESFPVDSRYLTPHYFRSGTW